MWLSDLRRRLLAQAAVAWIGLTLTVAQAAQPQPYEFFSGDVIELAADHLTVERRVKGKDQQKHTFLLRPETKVEGKLALKVRVTVGFRASDQGDVAVHVIVRSRPVVPALPKGF